MPFQNQRPGDSQAMISIIALLHCGEYNSAIGQAAEDPHKQKNWSYSIIPKNAGESQ